MGRRYSIHKNRQFQYVYRRGKSFPARPMVMIYLKGNAFRAGFSVSAKVGGAVVRNRVRRRMREQVRLLRHQLAPGQYIFVARNAAKDASSAEIARTLAYLANKAGVLIPKERP